MTPELDTLFSGQDNIITQSVERFPDAASGLTVVIAKVSFIKARRGDMKDVKMKELTRFEKRDQAQVIAIRWCDNVFLYPHKT